MADIVLCSGKLKVYQYLQEWCKLAGRPEQWGDEIWLDALTDQEYYEELVTFMEKEELEGKTKRSGYTLPDLYVWQLKQSNLFMDTGKNTVNCNKKVMVLEAFHTMTELKNNTQKCLEKLNIDDGMDRI